MSYLGFTDWTKEMSTARINLLRTKSFDAYIASISGIKNNVLTALRTKLMSVSPTFVDGRDIIQAEKWIKGTTQMDIRLLMLK